MNFFNDDPFEDIVREFFGKPGGRSNGNVFIRGEEEDRNIDFVEFDDFVFLVFELPGYSEDDVSVKVKGSDLVIDCSKNSSACKSGNVQDYLSGKLCRGESIKKILPKFVNPKNFKKSMKNGVLELRFKKKNVK